MRSFKLQEKEQDKRNNRIIIAGFLMFIVILSYIMYGSVSFGFNKMDTRTYGESTSYDSNEVQYLDVTRVRCGDGMRLRTYIAKSASEKEKGLSVFNRLKNDEAMLFVFDTLNKYSFWMKDMKFPIDIIWLDQDKKIVDIRSDVATSSYPEMLGPKSESMYVLEFNAGVANKSKIKIGDICNFDSSLLK